MKSNSKIFVAGAGGFVGSALLNALKALGFSNLLAPLKGDLDLTAQSQVNDFFERERPEYVFLIAAKNGGIAPNKTYPADFLYENLMIAANVIHGAHTCGARRLLYAASVYAYPKGCPQPIRETCFLDGKPEESSEGYAVAKICGIELCELYRKQYGDDFCAVILPHIYGPGDNFDPESATVMAALIRRIVLARRGRGAAISPWGTGRPLREFLFIDDLVDALIFLGKSERLEHGHINLGADNEVSVAELAEIIKEIAGYSGGIVFDASKPDGIYRNKLDDTLIRSYGWRAKTGLREGTAKTIQWFVENYCGERV